MNIFRCFIFLLILSICSIVYAKENFTIKIATLAPEGSTWMKIFNEFNREIIKKTNGNVRFKVYPGGVLGDERDMVRKIRIGQIHGGGFTGLGLSMIYKDILALQIPFLFKDYKEVDYVLNKMEKRFREGFRKKGFILLGFAEVGFIYLFSNVPITDLKDIKGLKFWIWEGDKIARVVFNKLGIIPVPLEIPDVLLALQTNLIDVVFNSPLGAVALQWFSRVKYMIKVPLSYGVGAILIKNKIFERLPSQYQKILKESAEKYFNKLNKKAREENEKAISVMKKHGIKIIELSEEKIADAIKLSQKAAMELAGKEFSKEILDKILFYLREYRSEK
ncbi:MAG TPA: ABC transporter substrate-binding protein, partial [Candidatus Desulfofervidus auxilii]|nr:ABC transporter substrate-binding protein [Candidatus Desulfofervidus auxilii]